MSTAAFIKGAKLKIDGIEFALIRKLPDSYWQLEAQATGELRRMSQTELLDGIAPGRVQFVIDDSLLRRDGPAFRKANAAKQFDLLPDAVKETAKLRRRIVHAILAEFGQVWDVKQVSSHLASIWPSTKTTAPVPHPVTVWRWIRRYLDSGKDIRALVPAHHRKGNISRRYPKEVEIKVREAVDCNYLSMERGKYQDALDHAIAEITRENRLRLKDDQLPIPKLDYIKRIAHETPAFDRYVARYGRPAAERRFRTVLGKTLAKDPLGRVEIDHSRLDVFVVDDESFFPLGVLATT